VCLVEGPFDELACKLLVPDAPVLTPLTKGIGEDHIEYLRILGVDTIVIMFDNEKSGQGRKGMERTKWRIETKFMAGIEVTSVPCAASDPSNALKSEPLAEELEIFLREL
jgi:hypothetical protein